MTTLWTILKVLVAVQVFCLLWHIHKHFYFDAYIERLQAKWRKKPYKPHVDRTRPHGFSVRGAFKPSLYSQRPSLTLTLYGLGEMYDGFWKVVSLGWLHTGCSWQLLEWRLDNDHAREEAQDELSKKVNIVLELMEGKPDTFSIDDALEEVKLELSKRDLHKLYETARKYLGVCRKCGCWEDAGALNDDDHYPEDDGLCPRCLWPDEYDDDGELILDDDEDENDTNEND